MFTLKNKKSFAVLALTFFLLSWWPLRLQADPNELYIDICGVVGNKIYNHGLLLSASDIAKMIEQEIGKDNYQQVTVVINSCHSGAASESMPLLLDGVFNIITSCNTFQLSGNKTSGDSFLGFSESFWDSVINNPNAPVDSHFENGKKGVPYKSNEQYEKEWNDYRNAVIKKNQQAGKEILKVPAPWGSNEVDKTKGQSPQDKQSDNNPGNKKIAAGLESNHAIMITTDPGKKTVDKQLTERVKKALGPEKAGFNSVAELTPFEQADKDRWGQDSTTRDDLATKENIRQAIRKLKPVMNDKEHLLFYVNAHGTNVEKSIRTSQNTGQNQGAVFDNINRTEMIGDFETTLSLGEGVLDDDGTYLVDHCWYDRWDSPALVIQTVEETPFSGEPLEVKINDIRLCDIVMDPLLGGFHYLPMDDAFIRALLNTTDCTQGFAVSFDFASEADSFKLATKDDMDILNLPSGYYGMSFVYHLEAAPVPEPASLMLFGLAFLFVAKMKKGRCII